MNIKYCIYIFLSIFAFTFTSCLGDSEQQEITYSTNAQILTFQLKHDSVPELANVLYTIDQQNSLIYNVDSLTYGVELPEKVVFNFTTAGYALLLLNGTADSTQLTTGDSIAIEPFVNKHSTYFRIYAYDFTSTKDYTINLRVHQIDPDSVVSEKLFTVLPDSEIQKVLYRNNQFYAFAQDNIYTSSDTKLWAPLPKSFYTPANLQHQTACVYGDFICATTSTGQLYYTDDCFSWMQVALPSEITSVNTIIGEIKGIANVAKPELHLIVESNGETVFAQTDISTWSIGEAVPADFPTTGFSAVSAVRGHNSTLTVVGSNSSNSIWRAVGAPDGAISWNPVVPEFVQGGRFPVPTAPNVFYYDNKMHLMNGIVDGRYNTKIYTSINDGLNWTEMPSKYAFAEEYEARGYASVCVSPDNYIYVLCGRGTSGFLADVWRGRLNRLGFGQ